MKPTDSFVYCWTNIQTNKLYIGSHKGKIDDGYISSSKYLLKEYKITPEHFSRQIIATGDWESMKKFEDILIRKMWANNILCYNKATGGLFKFDDAIRHAMSIALKGIPKTPQHRLNIAIANKKKARDPKILEKLCKPKPSGFGSKISAALTGKAKSVSHKLALSKSHKKTADRVRTGKTYDEIFGPEKAARIKEKSSNTQKGRPCNNPMVICPHCSLNGPSGAMTRWHFNNCRSKI